MKRNSILKLFVILCLAFSLEACSDDDSDFLGKDNYILAFSLSQGDAVYPASIEGNEIVLEISAGTSLDNASSKVVLSENASVSPNPASIKEWKDGQTFIVTSYGKDERIYTLKLNYNAVVVEDDFVLNTQQEVDDFAKKNITTLRGSLTLGQNKEVEENERIINIEGLKGLEEVERMLTINQSVSILDLSGLGNLQRVGAISIVNPNIEVLSFSKLTRVDMAFTLTVDNATSVNLKALAHVGGNFNLSVGMATEINLKAFEQCVGEFNVRAKSVSELSFPKLKKMGSNFYINANSAQRINLENLESTVGGISFSGKEVKSLDLHNLVSADMMTISSLRITELTLPKLTNVGGMYLSNMELLAKISAPQITKLNGFNIQNVGLQSVDFNKLTEIGNIEVQRCSTKNFKGFENVTTSSWIYIANNPELVSFSGLKNVIPTLYSGSWNVRDNAYNPTYEEMVNGLYEQQ